MHGYGLQYIGVGFFFGGGGGYLVNSKTEHNS